jgi:hypothetical protein
VVSWAFGVREENVDLVRGHDDIAEAEGLLGEDFFFFLMREPPRIDRRLLIAAMLRGRRACCLKLRFR